MAREFDNYSDLIDSRDVIEAIEELQNEWSATTGNDYSDYSLSSEDLLAGLSADDAERLTALIAFQDEAQHSADWQHGEALIRDSYFQDYAEQMAEDIGAIPSDAPWPIYCIDWERAARELQADYTAVEFDGVTYWIRS